MTGRAQRAPRVGVQTAERPKKKASRRRTTSLVELDQPDSVWNRAAAKGAHGDPFCCRTEWQLSFHETFGPRRAPIVRKHRGNVIAFAERHDAELGPLLEPIEANWLFGCPLLGPEAVDLLDQLLQQRDQQPRRPSVLISGILPGSDLRNQLAATFHARYRVFALEPNHLCSASLDGGLDGFLSRRTGRLRRNLRQQARRAEQRGVYFERCAPGSVAEAAATYERMLAVERKSWKGIGRCGMAESPSREFYAVMLRRLAASGAGRVIFARCGGDDVGFIFGGVAAGAADGAVYRGQQFSFVEQWRGASIGNLLQVEQVRWLGEEGVGRYDMGPVMDYKRQWTEVSTRLEVWLMRPAG